MMQRQFRKVQIVIWLVAILLAACGRGPDSDGVRNAPAVEQESANGSTEIAIAAVNATRIEGADNEPGNWLSHGRTYSEQRFSPLKGINDGNVSNLGLAWHYDLETRRGMEATPLVVDGVMFSTGSWSIVYAHDARTGDLLWSFDPQVPRAWAVHLCCDAVNRGVAMWEGRVFVGTLDGRLIGIDATDGKMIWSTQTTDTDRPYSITGAPRVIKGQVIIGNGGAEYGVRGYVSAYDADSGEMTWRFYTVPGDPSEPFESPAMQMAADTWHGGEWWEIGGGGTVWDSMAYDPELDLLYVGVGNGAPWNQYLRSPGGGDNLFLSSIVALRPDSGEYVWHYQTTPGDRWDYTATQHMILADLEIDGALRKVLMQAPKNGFFYVIDRVTGDFISAEPYVPVSWASRIDPASGRPVLTESADYSQTPQLTFPAPYGGHNWHPMAYSPDTGLVYIPAQEIPFVYSQDDAFEYTRGFWNTGVDIPLNTLPDDPESRKALMSMVKGQISAWDPVAQAEVWRVQHNGPWNGGMLASAGNLLFQGNANGEFVAYRADNGERLWAFPAQTGIVAAPISFEIDGEQYVTVVAGWGGVLALGGGALAAAAGVSNVSRILTFRLDANGSLPPLEELRPNPDPPPRIDDEELIASGKHHFNNRCSMCHGLDAVGGGVVPDLRFMSAQSHEQFYAVMLGGLHSERGMVSFAAILDAQDAKAIHAYLIGEAHRYNALAISNDSR
jgi:PQQ-dependent dehydrogenase (methanol/ethanol family)